MTKRLLHILEDNEVYHLINLFLKSFLHSYFCCPVDSIKSFTIKNQGKVYIRTHLSLKKSLILRF